MLSKKASLKENSFGERINGKLPKIATITHAKVENKKVCLRVSLNSLSKFDKINNTPIKIVMNEDDNSIEVFCVVSTYSKTGVEMEAIMGVNAALITIYDLSKIVNPNLKINNIKLLIKEGGKSGLWKNPEGIPEFLKDLF